MGRLRRTMRIERLESRSLFAAALGIADIVIDQATGESQVATSIEINNAAGIRAATVEIIYDQDLLQADLSSVRAGTIWEGKGVAIANLNDEDGKITAFVFSTEDMSLSSGTLLDIDFIFNDDSPANARARVGLGSVRINEGDIPISAAPIPGQKTIAGSITRQADSIRPDTQNPVELPLKSAPSKPAPLPRPTATWGAEFTPQWKAPSYPPASRPAALPVSSQQSSPASNSSPTAEEPAAGPQDHTSLHCTPISNADIAAVTAGGDTAFPVASASAIDEALPHVLEHSADLFGPQPPVEDALDEGLSDAPALLGPITEPTAVTADLPLVESADMQPIVRAKQALDAGDYPRRLPLPGRAVAWSTGSQAPSRSNGFSSLLWLLSHRSPSEPQSDYEDQGE